MKKTSKKKALLVLAILVLLVAAFAVPTLWGKPWFIEHFYARVFVEHMLDHPQLLSSLRIFEPMGLDFHNDDLEDYSVEGSLRDQRRSERALATLRSYNRNDLADKLSYDVLEWFLDNAAENGRWILYGYPVNQQFGFQSNLPNFMVNTHRIDDKKGAENYLARLRGFELAFGQTIDTMRRQEEAGVVPPHFVLEHVLREMREFISVPVAEHLLVTHFSGEIEKIGAIDESTCEELRAEAVDAVSSVVYPAYERLIAHCADLARRATDDDGVWKLPDGNEYYAHRLRSYTTTDMTADEVHDLGLREIARIQAEMKAILEAEGLPTDDLAATMKALNEDPRFLYADSDEGKQQVLDDYTAIISEIEAGLDGLFLLKPTAGVVVERVPEFREATAPGAYYDGPPLDGSRPGTFYANLRDVTEIPKFGMRTLAYHEAIPGHHFQIALAREMRGVPFFRRVIPFTAYVEGWALYAEQLAAENGYQDDPYDRLGYLVAQAMRAVRLVVDTGIHHQRWTRDQAIEYMLANTGMPEGEVVSEVERYIVDPGQATAYMVGYLEIMRLREEARQRLGEGFDIRVFHRVVLEHGALPLTLLRREVEQWCNASAVNP